MLCTPCLGTNETTSRVVWIANKPSPHSTFNIIYSTSNDKTFYDHVCHFCRQGIFVYEAYVFLKLNFCGVLSKLRTTLLYIHRKALGTFGFSFRSGDVCYVQLTCNACNAGHEPSN